MSNFVHEFKNGLTLVAEQMDWLESAAFALLVPAGCCYEDPKRAGLASFTCEMVQRGCGNRDSRQFVEDLELMGAHCSAAVTNSHASFGGATPAENLLNVLEVYADAVRRPHLPEEQIEDARLVCIQEVLSLADEPAQRTLIELRGRHYSDPFGRSSLGQEETLQAVQIGDVKRFFRNSYQPQGAILSVAGKIDWPKLLAGVERMFGDWQTQVTPPLTEIAPSRGYNFVPDECSQTHIGIAYDAIPYRDPNYYLLRGAIGVLSDGMSSRLFTEVREKRGLCYTVYAVCHSLLDRGSVLCYSGTTTERAQETLDVIVAELRKLADGIEADELDRLKARIKSSLIMQQESSPARSSSLASDWYFLKRIQTPDELRRIIDGLTVERINAYLKEHVPREFTIVTVGEKELEVPSAVS